MTRNSRPYRQSLLESRSNPAEAEAYLNAALEDSQARFLKAVKNVALASAMSKVAQEAGIQRETLYRSFSEQGNPIFETPTNVLAVLGMRIVIAARDDAREPAPSEELSAPKP